MLGPVDAEAENGPKYMNFSDYFVWMFSGGFMAWKGGSEFRTIGICTQQTTYRLSGFTASAFWRERLAEFGRYTVFWDVMSLVSPTTDTRSGQDKKT
jgi:hypothetical protein